MESLTNYGLGMSRTNKHLLSYSKGSAHGGIWIEAGIFWKSQEKSQVSLFSSTHDVAQVTSKSGCQGGKKCSFFLDVSQWHPAVSLWLTRSGQYRVIPLFFRWEIIVDRCHLMSLWLSGPKRIKGAGGRSSSSGVLCVCVCNWWRRRVRTASTSQP